MPSKKIKQLEREFRREILRLQNLGKVAKLKGIDFTLPSIKAPKEITEEQVQRLRSVSPEDIFSGAANKTVEEIFKQTLPKTTTESASRRRKSALPDVKGGIGRTGAGEQPHELLSDEERARIRAEAARKAAISRAKHEAEDPEFKARMDEIRRRNLEKAREAREANLASKPPKEPKPKLSPEELKELRRESIKKASEKRREREANDPDFKKRMDEQRKAALEKARASRPPKQKKEKVKKTAEELKKIRTEAAKKAAKTRKEREAKDPEYRQRMQESRKKALEKAREANKSRAKDTSEEARKRRAEIAKKAAESRRRHEAEDPEFKSRMDEIRKKNLEKAREAKWYKRLDKDLEDIYGEGWDEVDLNRDVVPNEDEVFYDTLFDKFSKEDNEIFDFIWDELDTPAKRSDAFDRMKELDEDMIEMTDVMLQHPYEEVYREQSIKILSLIYGPVVPEEVQRKLDEHISQMIKDNKLRTSNRKPYHRGWQL